MGERGPTQHTHFSGPLTPLWLSQQLTTPLPASSTLSPKKHTYFSRSWYCGTSHPLWPTQQSTTLLSLSSSSLPPPHPLPKNILTFPGLGRVTSTPSGRLSNSQPCCPHPPPLCPPTLSQKHTHFSRSGSCVTSNPSGRISTSLYSTNTSLSASARASIALRLRLSSTSVGFKVGA